MLKFLLRVVLFFVGLILAAGLATALLVVVVAWSLRNGWARLTGRPLAPFVMRFNPGAGFDRFRHATRPPEPSAADFANARARGESMHSATVLGIAPDVGDVTDVSSRPASRSG